MSQHGAVAPIKLNHRADFVASMTDGRTVMEYGANSPSTKEVRKLWSYLNGRLRLLAGWKAAINAYCDAQMMRAIQ